MRRSVTTRKKRVSGKKRVGAIGSRRRGSRRRRSVGAANDIGGMLMQALGWISGGIAGRELNNLLIKFFGTSFTPTESVIAQIGGGLALRHFIKNSFVQDLGVGMVVNGGTAFIVNTGIIGAAPMMSYSYSRPGLNGTNFKFISGPTTRIGDPNFAVVAGRKPRKRQYVS